MAEREIQNPPCPKCKGRTNEVTFDGYGTLYECCRGGCLEQFRVVAGRIIGEGTADPQLRSAEAEKGSPPPQDKSSRSAEPPTTRSPRTSDVEAGSPETKRNRKENEMSQRPKEWKLECEVCHEEFEVPQALGAHRRYKHAGATAAAKEKPVEKEPKTPAVDKPSKQPRAPRAAAASRAGTNGSAIPRAIEELRAKREALIAAVPGLKELDAAIGALESLANKN